MLKFIKKLPESVTEIVEAITVIGGFSIGIGVVVSLIVHSFTSKSPNPMNIEILVISVTLIVIFALLRLLVFVQLKRKWKTGELEQFKQHEMEWLKSCNRGIKAFIAGVISLVLAVGFTANSLNVPVQIGYWTSSIDSVFIVINLLIYALVSISIIGNDITKWLQVEQIVQNSKRFETFCIASR